MKYILFFSLSTTLLCLGCQDQTTTSTETEKVDDTEKLWLTFKGDKEDSKHIVFISGDEEYRSEEAMPQLAKIMSKTHGFTSTVLFAQNPDTPGIIDANYGANIPGLEALSNADMMVIFTRFRSLPNEQMKHIDAYLKAGKPVLGIRTSTHAFNFNKESDSEYKHYSHNYSGELKEWEGGFGRLVLGEKWINHHGHHKHQSSRGIVAEGAKSLGIINGIADGDVWGSTDVYGVRLPLPGDAQPIILGQVMNRKGEFDETDIFYGMKPTDDDVAATNNKEVNVNDPMMPIAWTKSYQLPGGTKGKAVASTIGAASDMLIEGTRRLLVNGIFWAMDIPVPEKANVDIVGEFQPTKYEFRKDEYWSEKQLKVADFK